MSLKARLSMALPLRMRSQASGHATRCVLQRFDTDEGSNVIPLNLCDARSETDPHTFGMHVVFVRMHGIPRGSITTFSNQAGGAPGA